MVERTGETSELVAPAVPAGGRRVAAFCEPRRPSLVLGSAQRDDVVDQMALAAAGREVARRRSGGGAVLVAPAAQLWLDVFVPAGDELLVADVGASAWWLGEWWAEALAAAEGRPLAAYAVHRGGASGDVVSRLACFAGLGPGEVTRDGRKLVGVSQRRTRGGAWLHSMALAAGDPGELAGLLLVGPGERDGLAARLRTGVALLGAPPGAVRAALLAALGEPTRPPGGRDAR